MKTTIIREIVKSIVLNGLLPLALYLALQPRLPETRALALAVILPALLNLLTFLKTRRVDVFGGFILAGFVLSLLLALLGGGRHWLLVRDSLISGVLGLAMLVTLFFPRPMIFYFAARFMAGGDAAREAAFRARWISPAFRRVMRLMTLVWGTVLLLEAAVRTLLAFSLPITTCLSVMPIIQYGFLLGVIWWTVYYARLSMRRAKIEEYGGQPVW